MKKTINVENCCTCPFAYLDIDYDACGRDTIMMCAFDKGYSSSTIAVYDSWEDNFVIPLIPDWCKLKKYEEITVKLMPIVDANKEGQV